jgi:hypothetical protein
MLWSTLFYRDQFKRKGDADIQSAFVFNFDSLKQCQSPGNFSGFVVDDLSDKRVHVLFTEISAKMGI